MFFFQQRPFPSYPTIVWLNFSQEHIRLPLICEQTSSLLPIGWQDMPPLPLIQSDSNSALQRGEREGGWGRGWRKRRKVFKEAGGGGRVNGGRELTHMWQDRAVLLMGREKYNNLKRDDRCGFHQPPLCHIYHEASRPDNSSASFPVCIMLDL